MTISTTLNLVSFQNNVATTPFVDLGPTKTEVGQAGFVVIKQKHDLTALKVVFNAPNLGIEAGDVVFVLADSYLTHWGKNVYTINGQDFILIPKESIVILNRTNPDWAFGD